MGSWEIYHRPGVVDGSPGGLDEHSGVASTWSEPVPDRGATGSGSQNRPQVSAWATARISDACLPIEQGGSLSQLPSRAVGARCAQLAQAVPGNSEAWISRRLHTGSGDRAWRAKPVRLGALRQLSQPSSLSVCADTLLFADALHRVHAAARSGDSAQLHDSCLSLFGRCNRG